MDDEPRRLPGSKEDQADTHGYLVLFRDAALNCGERGRLVQSGTEYTRTMIENLIDSLREREVDIAREQIGEPTAFGAVALNVTKEIADKVRDLPEVEAIVRE